MTHDEADRIIEDHILWLGMNSRQIIADALRWKIHHIVDGHKKTVQHLQGIIDGMSERIATQSEQLSRLAEKNARAQQERLPPRGTGRKR